MSKIIIQQIDYRPYQAGHSGGVRIHRADANGVHGVKTYYPNEGESRN